jgi:hypothetical protein
LNFEHVEQTNPVAAELLRLCAFLEPETIPEELISEAGAAPGPLLQQIAIDALALNEAIEELRAMVGWWGHRCRFVNDGRYHQPISFFLPK